jgi:hypothetical protein
VGEVAADDHEVHGLIVLLVEVAHRPAAGVHDPELQRPCPPPAVLGFPSRLQCEPARRVGEPGRLCVGPVVAVSVRLGHLPFLLSVPPRVSVKWSAPQLQ